MSIRLRRSEVPEHLRNSLFYSTLSEEDNDIFSINCEYLKVDCSVATVGDLECLLSTLRFWGTTSIPEEIYAYVLSNWSEECEVVVSRFSDELTFLKDVVAVAEAPHEQRVNKALRTGNASLICYVLHAGFRFDEFTSSIAAGKGDVESLLELHRLGCQMTQETVIAAASAGHLSCLECLERLEYTAICNNRTFFADEAVFAAAENGHTDCVRFLYSHQPPSMEATWEVCRRAAIRGRAACLRFAVEHSGRNVSMYLETVAESGDLECLQYVHSEAGSWEPSTSPTAILFGGNLACVQYALNTGCTFRYVDLMDAMSHCDLSIVKCLLEHGEWLGPESITAAATCNRLDCMQYLHERGCEWDAQTCRAAAGHGHLQCLQFAHEHGSPWDVDVCERASAQNHLHCLQYLHENGCPWDERTIEAALQRKSTECLEYARAHGCPEYSAFQRLRRDVKAGLSNMFPTKTNEPEYFDFAAHVP